MRQILTDKEDNRENLVFSTYFCTKVDPQRRAKFQQENDFAYIRDWYLCVHHLQLNAVIFCDNLDDEFIEKYETDRIWFVRCTLGDYSLNDERFLLYELYLKEKCINTKNVFFTDVSDVLITADPFQFANSYASDTIFIGRTRDNLIRHSILNVLERIPTFEKDKGIKIPRSFYNQPIFNAGIIGGEISNILELITSMNQEFRSCDSFNNNNMMILNYILWRDYVGHLLKERSFWEQLPIKYYRWTYSLFKNKTYSKFLYPLRKLQKSLSNHDNRNDVDGNIGGIVTSYPFCSKFKSFEKSSNAIFIHK